MTSGRVVFSDRDNQELAWVVSCSVQTDSINYAKLCDSFPIVECIMLIMHLRNCNLILGGNFEHLAGHLVACLYAVTTKQNYQH